MHVIESKALLIVDWDRFAIGETVAAIFNNSKALNDEHLKKTDLAKKLSIVYLFL